MVARRAQQVRMRLSPVVSFFMCFPAASFSSIDAAASMLIVEAEREHALELGLFHFLLDSVFAVLRPVKCFKRDVSARYLAAILGTQVVWRLSFLASRCEMRDD